MINWLNNYENTKSFKIFKRKGFNGLNYADKAEDFLIHLFEEEKSNYNYSYPIELHKYITNWDTEYHLSVKRLNTIEAFIDLIPKKDRVLELGAGTGIITSLLSYYFSSVDVVEGSLKRAEIIRKRLISRRNINIFIDDVSEFVFPENYYDLVTLIGVLEYIPYYKNIEEIYILMEKIAKSLDSKGIVLIAIENKFGAKYFTGCREDHNGILFSGIIGYPIKSPITFSRRELEDILKNSGFENIQFYHSFPDYKLPSLIIREDEDFYNLKPSGLFLENFPSNGMDRQYLFSDVLFLENIIKSKQLSTFGNSFIVLASKNKEVKLQTNWIARKFYNYVGDSRLHHTIEFLKDGNGYKVYKKSLAIAGGSERLEKGKLIYDLNSYERKFIKGKNLLIKALENLFAGNYSEIINIFNTVNNFIIKEYFTGNYTDSNIPLVKGVIDCCLWNLVEDEETKKIAFVDRKYMYLEDLPLDFLLQRSLNKLYELANPFMGLGEKYMFFKAILTNIYNTYNRSRFNYFLRKEKEF